MILPFEILEVMISCDYMYLFYTFNMTGAFQKGKQGKKRKHAKSDDHQQEDVMVDEELLQDEDVREKV